MFLQISHLKITSNIDELILCINRVLDSFVECPLGSLELGMMNAGVGRLAQYYLLPSCTQLMIDAEIVRMVKRVAQGVDVNDATLAVDVINQVGPGKDFLVQKHKNKFYSKKTLGKCL
jgi:trimethylamine:corrinoid methyltransferase-like protein